MLTIARYRQTGFGLVEVMVGLVIGMIAVIVMMQILALSEGQKRNTTSGDDAISNGAIALYTLQRDIRESGWGTNAFKLIGCDVTLRAGVILTGMAPVTINHPNITGQDANTDTLLVVTGSANWSPEGDGITAQPATATYSVQTANSFAGNDWVIAMPQSRPSPCSLTLDQVKAGAVAPNVDVVTGVAGNSNGTLYNLGQTPAITAYAVRAGNLTACDYIANNCGLAANNGNAAIWLPIANNIVSLRAQYGKDTTPGTMDAIVDTYNPTAPANTCEWARISAARFAIVARGAQLNKDVVTNAAPKWSGSATAASVIDLSATVVPATFTWQNYRYKVFETTTELRNMAWMGVQAGC